MNYVIKIFMMVFGVLMIVLMATLLTNLSNQACSSPSVADDDTVVSFGQGFINGIYDSMCMTLIEANNAIWNAYANWFVGLIGQKSNVASIGGDLWGMAQFFCIEHSNFEYSSSTGAISNPAIFKEIFLYELERCWSMFEGNTTIPIDSRHPLGKNVLFDCAEIIYDFTANNDYVTFGELLARMLHTNPCQERFNAPAYYLQLEQCVGDSINEFSGDFTAGYCTALNNRLVDSIMWCAPKDKMTAYWYQQNADGFGTKLFRNPNSFSQSGGDVASLSCTTQGGVTPVEQKWFTSSSCLGYEQALCSFANIPGYGDRGDSSDGSSAIAGCGKITISYFDYFDWGNFFAAQRAGDDYPACGYLDIFNNFETLGSDTWWRVDDDIAPRLKNSIVICYEKFDESCQET